MKHTNFSQQYCALQAQERTELYNAVCRMKNHWYEFEKKDAPVIIAYLGDEAAKVSVEKIIAKEYDNITLIVRPNDDVFQRKIDVSDVMIGYVSCLIDALPDNEPEYVFETRQFDAWEYIAERLPDYYTNSDVACCNDLQCYLDNECDEITEKNIQRLLPGNRKTIEAYKHYLEPKLYIEAFETKIDFRKQNGSYRKYNNYGKRKQL